MTKTVIFQQLLLLVLIFDATNSLDNVWNSFPFGPQGNPFGPGFPFNHVDNMNFQNNLHHNLDQQFSSFQNQMNQFNKQMNKQMEQVRYKTEVIGLVSQMARGQGGTTIISYNGKQLIVKNDVFGLCNGNVIDTDINNIQCTGPITYETENDVCRPVKQSLARVNDYICIRNPNWNGNFQVTSVNGNINCENGQLFTTAAFKAQCGQNVFSPTYAVFKYIPDKRSPNQIPMPNRNPYLPCSPSNAPYCIFSTDISGITYEGQNNLAADFSQDY